MTLSSLITSPAARCSPHALHTVPTATSAQDDEIKCQKVATDIETLIFLIILFRVSKPDFFCDVQNMLSNSTQLGATTNGTTFADIIINNVNSVAEGTIQGFAQFVHDPKALKDTVSLFAKAAAPRKFADAVVLRRIETQKLDDIWAFPLNMSCPTTAPLPWTIVEASLKSQMQKVEYEFNIMRTVDFVGRNYIRLVLPQVDCSAIVDSATTNETLMSDPAHMYLGAWHRDLIPRLIEKIEFYPRSNAHKLFEYSGYDIFVHNVLFGNCHKEMNDLMSGEDKFELCYDPYRVDGSALGLASFKGIDAWADYEKDTDPAKVTTAAGVTTFKATAQGTVYGAKDNIIDYFQLDTTMDNEEFRNVYRRNVWYEAPVAKNYSARHSIHSRRMFHQKKEITIPLDILPFGYSIGASLPSAALSGECGFIRIKLFADWLDRAFYLTKVSDVPSLHPIVNHKHYAQNDTTPEGFKLETATDYRIGWVNERSLGRFGDPYFEVAAAKGADDFDSVTKFSTPGNVLNTPAGFNNRENIVPTTVSFAGIANGETKLINGQVYNKANAKLKRKGNWSGVVRESTTADLSAVQRGERLTDYTGKSSFIHKFSSVDPTLGNQIKDELGLKLLQVGYQTLPCIREFLSKLPNIYITTEWDDKTLTESTQNFDINNDLYIQAIVLWFVPQDANGIESMRVYPCHLIDHELPIIAGLKLVNEQSQGTTVYDWHQLNIVNIAQMNLNPLLDNMGLISFSPTLTANTFPHAYYDSNINGYLKAQFLSGEGDYGIGQPVNMRSGKVKIFSIGINGVALVNLSVFRLIF